MALKVPEKITLLTRPVEVITAGITSFTPELTVAELEIQPTSHEAFLDKLGFTESSNDYEKVNRLGYMGKYQFGKTTLKLLDIHTTKKEFISDPELQEYAVLKLLQENKKSLKKYIKKYDGKIVHGVYVTESGILAAAHLGGAGNVSYWIKHGEDFKDGNGTSITKYMKIFSGYSLDLE
jgi:hypothetical protein